MSDEFSYTQSRKFECKVKQYLKLANVCFTRWSHFETEQVCTVQNKQLMLVPDPGSIVPDISGSSHTVHNFVKVVHAPAPC